MTHTTTAFTLLKENRFVKDPIRATSGSSGLDIHHYSYTRESIKLSNRKVTVVHTGLYVKEIPHGYELQLRLRSGLSVMGVVLANGIGTIDQDYRGEIKIPLISLKDGYELADGIRIAQLVLTPVLIVNPTIEILKNHIVPEEDNTRGMGGFGSTGIQ